MRAPAIRIAIFVLALLAPGFAKADQARIKSTLKSAYQNKVVILRRFYANRDLRFDASGKPVGKADPGYWSSDGMLQIKKISLDHGVLRIDGNSIVNRFDSQMGAFTNVTTKNQVHIEVELEPSWQDAAPVQQLLGKIFSSDMQDVADTLPEYWQWCLADGIHQDKTGNWRCGNPSMAETSDDPRSRLPDGTVVYRVKNGVTPPKLSKAPDPEYTEPARALRLQGTSVLWFVLDENGIPSRIRIVRPLGVGLDDRAVEAVRTWKFNPATLDGHPVPVQVNVEVNFRLY
jgi:TonB family protein